MISKLIILLFLVNTTIYAQLRITDETKFVIQKLEQLHIYFDIYVKNPNDSSNLSKLSEVYTEITNLKNDFKYWSRVQTSNSKYIEIDKKISNLAQIVNFSLSLIEKAKLDQNNLEIMKSIMVGDNICYIVVDQRGGSLTVYFEVRNKTENALQGFVTSIGNYDPYMHLDHEEKSINSCTINNKEYHVRELYYFSKDLIPDMKKCD